MKTKTGSLIVGAVLAILLIVGAGYADLSEGLVAYYPFDGNADDASGNGHHGVVGGNPISVPGRVGSALSFDGIDDYVEAAPIAEDLLASGGSLAMSKWVNMIALPYERQRIIGCEITNDAFVLDIFQAQLTMFSGTGAGPHYSTGITIEEGVWYHLAVTFQEGPNRWDMFVNGVQADTMIQDWGWSGGQRPLIIGADAGNIDVPTLINLFSNAIIDEVRIYNRALSEPEIQQLAGTAVAATIDIDPDTLNLSSNGKWVTCYIELPEGYNVMDIDGSTVKLEGIPAYLGKEGWARAGANSGNILDHDGDGMLERMVKFDGSAVREYLLSLDMLGDIALTVTGDLVDGPSFEGFGVVRITQGGN